MKKNELAVLTILDINNRGYGVARAEDGRVVFVANAVTGETVQAKYIKVTKDYAVARVEKTLTKSACRIPSDCQAFPACGGCVYRHIAYDDELKLKENYVKSAFKKAGVAITVAPCEYGDTEGYRNKIECPLTDGYKAGFYAAKTHRVIAADDCKLEKPQLRAIMTTVTAWLEENDIPLYHEEDGKGLVRHIYLRIGEKSGEVSLVLVLNGKTLPHAQDFVDTVTQKHPAVVSILLSHNEENTNVILGKSATLLYGKDEIEDTLCSLTFRLSHRSFYQVNAHMAEKLYQKALTLAALTPDDTLADLFCGVGTIGLFMLKESGAKSLLGIEIIPEAIENARRNAKLNGIENATFLCGDANREELASADVIVVDPPRKGCEESLLCRIAAIAPKRLVYISCNPDTLARDVAVMAKYGYTTDTVYPFDLFPRTGHVESVVCLTRSDKAT
ncbi:MAG: 23S rRNA (uracil(1939)-C(5))-methyltransferase RlmD [Clostridia bacterium]|nr:23S rRNA (uracil(1939)-C(5))-methyltransferase RlmD [Clostridia bacterium]